MTDAPPETLLVRYIKAHVRKGEQAKERADHNREKAEQHFIAAGAYLATLKTHYAPTWAEWEILLNAQVHLSASRASELIQLADGRKSLQTLRDSDAEKHRRLRQSSSGQPQCPEENEEPPVETDTGTSTLAPTPATPTIPVTTATGTDAAAADLLIDALTTSSSATRDIAVDLLKNGYRQADFERATGAVVDLYWTLAKVGR